MSEFDYKGQIEEDGKVIATGVIDNVALMPGKKELFNTNFPALKPKKGSEYFINFYAYQKNDDGLLKAGDLMASEQVAIPVGNSVSGNSSKEGDERFNGKVKVGFNEKTGALNSYVVNGKELIKKELELNFWRASTDNDLGSDLTKRVDPWRNAGENAKLINMQRVDGKDGEYSVISEYLLPECVGNSKFVVTYSVKPNGAVNINSLFIPANDTLPLMPRLGVTLTLKREFDNMEWYGRGPHEDRKGVGGGRGVG